MLVDDAADVRAGDRVLGIVSVGALDIDRVLAGDDVGERDVHLSRGDGNWNRCIAEVAGDDTSVITFGQPRHPFREQEIRESLHWLGAEIVAISAMKMNWVSSSGVASHGGRRSVLGEAGS